jgi:hypothetical protein
MVMVSMKVWCTLPLSEVIPSCKTDEGVGDYDIDKGPMHEVEHCGGFLAASFLHPQHTTIHAKAISKGKGLICLLAPTLSTIKHDFSHLKLIKMVKFAYYSKHAKVSNQILINIKP